MQGAVVCPNKPSQEMWPFVAVTAKSALLLCVLERAKLTLPSA